ncbi:lysophospholipid acyltransferase family protein [Streptomyces sp. TRM 70361]|uniref:lysophospholipid acyltransferase family protein n=1 Tax=Streptomyces sp. TRM 70361 TaxID=3116553 RepID=UPI002E7C001D|nr:lysophospholipid acyltransferase family protein [Streptomyces sp. TRM 70361]MEE1942861.1 lysophospholipid acyltransferase family protein [Streptomyces sp. TRM 70361]
MGGRPYGAATAGSWLPVSPCSVTGCLPGRPAVVGPLRRAARRTALAAVLVAGVVALPVVRRRAPERRARLVRRWAGAVAAAAGVRVRITGVPAAGPVLVVANHVSWLDVPLLAAVAPGRMLAKREVGGYPVVGPLAARGGTLFIDRERLRALPETVGALTGALRAGSTAVVFPEGGTWCGRERGVFRPAVFQAALDAGVPVQPVALRYLRDDGRPGVTAARTTQAAFVGDDTLMASLRRVVAARGLVAEVTVLPPLPVGAHPDRRALARAAQRAVAAALAGEGGEGGREREPVGSGREGRWRMPATAPARDRARPRAR